MGVQVKALQSHQGKLRVDETSRITFNLRPLLIAAMSNAPQAHRLPPIASVEGAPIDCATQPARRFPKGARPSAVITQRLSTRPRICSGVSNCNAVFVLVIDITVQAPKAIRSKMATFNTLIKAKARLARPPRTHNSTRRNFPRFRCWLSTTRRIAPDSAPIPDAEFSTPRPGAPI